MQEILLNQVKLNFSSESLFFLNIVLAFIMFGVALQLKINNFSKLFNNPKSTIAGIISQFFLLPFITFILIIVMKPNATVALGMLLVASCPGGNISNFFTSLAKGNVELSVGLTTFSTIFSVIMTPLNFGFWGGLYVGIGNHPVDIVLNPLDMFYNIFLILGIPVILGILFSRYFPKITARISYPIKIVSMIIFILFVAIAFFNNSDIFINYIHLVIGLVFLHNLFAILTGYFVGKVFGLSLQDKRTLAIETGIQNSGLGLILIFSFFNGIGGMAIVAAWWGIWHIITGFGLAFLWSGKSKKVYA